MESFRAASGVRVDVAGFGSVVGDIAWGGNWFFVTGSVGIAIEIRNLSRLSAYCAGIRAALIRSQSAGVDVDHIEINEPSPTPGVDARNFVLCPGLVYDRSPSGTGTSAKLACLAASGALAPETPWRQESITGAVFEARYRNGSRGVLPSITGTAFVTARSRLLLDPLDPFAWGVGRSSAPPRLAPVSARLGAEATAASA